MDNFYLTNNIKLSMLFVWRCKMKTGDVVLYVNHSCVEVGKLGAKWDKDTWFVIPLAPFKNPSKRKEKFIRPITDLKKYLTFIK